MWDGTYIHAPLVDQELIMLMVGCNYQRLFMCLENTRAQTSLCQGRSADQLGKED